MAANRCRGGGGRVRCRRLPVGVFKVAPRASAATFAPPDTVLSVILVPVGTLPFAARRRAPVTVLAVIAVATAILSGLGRSPLFMDVTLAITVHTVAIGS